MCRIQEMGRKRLLRVIVLSILSGLAESMGILALVPLIKLVGFDNGMVTDWNLPLALAAYVMLVGGGAMVVRQRTLEVRSLSLEFLDRLRSKLHDAILHMEWARFRTLRTSDLLQSITGEIARIGQGVFLLDSLTSMLLTIPAVLITSFVLSWPLTLVALLVGGIIALITRHLGTQGFLLAREQGKVNQNATADLADDLAGLRVIKSFSAEQRRVTKISARFTDIRCNQMAYVRAIATERATLQSAAAVASALALFIAVSIIKVPPAEALVLIIAYARLLQLSLRAISSWRKLSDATAALQSYDETLQMCSTSVEPISHTATTLPTMKRKLSLESISVSYLADDEMSHRPALMNITADIPKGAITALIGPSGAGKSTLTDVIAGLIVADSGRMLVDNMPLSTSDRTQWRRRIALVPQEPFLFHDTIASNLRLSYPEATEAEMWEALEAASVADVVQNLPNGLETIAGPRGDSLSGGERQRIVLARALIRRPEILILDEATSSLDKMTEKLVAETLNELKGRCTILVVAHRLETIRHADKVLLLDNSRLVADGSFEDISEDIERVLGVNVIQ